MHIYCKGCGKHVGELMAGSKIRKGTVYLCIQCEIRRIASDLSNKTKSSADIFSDFLKQR